jgi:hypothetical protein
MSLNSEKQLKKFNITVKDGKFVTKEDGADLSFDSIKGELVTTTWFVDKGTPASPGKRGVAEHNAYLATIIDNEAGEIYFIKTKLGITYGKGFAQQLSQLDKGTTIHIRATVGNNPSVNLSKVCTIDEEGKYTGVSYEKLEGTPEEVEQLVIKAVESGPSFKPRAA